MGEVMGSTKVTVLAGDIGAALDPEAARPLANKKGKVFGGARMANVGGRTFVYIDGKNFTKDNTTIPDYIVVNQVFGGNDAGGAIRGSITGNQRVVRFRSKMVAECLYEFTISSLSRRSRT